ncbi:MAG: helix-turn-helix transcriptional regulator [Flavobacteriales bacterium]|nr:helix-turn-helix transcriptional regulator [Flavobacteriales bacterium]
MERQSDQKRIALRLLDLRESRGLSQEKLAAVLGIRQPAYCELESAHTKLTAARALVLADFYRITVDELLRGTRDNGQRTTDNGQRTTDNGQRTDNGQG